MNKELISVIIPVYNTENYLSKCLDSVINQTYDNLEIIVVNDGSTDNSLSIIKKYANKDKRIVVIDKENGGGAEARNVALDLAKGDYYAFVDSDDYIEIDMYEKMLEHLHKNNAEMAICSFRTTLENKRNKDIKDVVYNTHELMKEIFLDETITSHFWRKLYPARVFEGNRFPNKKVVHDMSLDHILLSQINSAVYFDDDLYIYRNDNTSNLSNSNAKNINSSLNRAKVMLERLEFADKKYPDLSYILIPKVTMFLLSSYAKLNVFYKEDKENMDYVVKNIKKKKKRILSSNNVPLSHKAVIFSIANNLKLISTVASKFYVKNYL